MQTVFHSETSFNVYKGRWRHAPEVSIPRNRLLGNHKSHAVDLLNSKSSNRHFT